MNKHINIFTKSFVNKNPLVLLSVGLCSALGATTNIIYGFSLGVCICFVLLCSELIMSLSKKLVSKSLYLPLSIIVMTTFTIIAQLFLKTYFEDIYKGLGIFLPLIVTNATILKSATEFSTQNTVLDSIIDALAVGLAFIAVLVCISAIREFLGLGTLMAGTPLKVKIIPEDYCIQILKSTSGGFLIFGFFAAFATALTKEGGKNE